MLSQRPLIKPNSPLKEGPIAHLDVGESQVKCLIASAGADGTPRIAGRGSLASEGVSATAITDGKALSKAILGAVSAAEEKAGLTVSKAAICFSVGQPVSHFCDIDVDLAGHPVRAHDIERIFTEAERVFLDRIDLKHRRLILLEPTAYLVDDNFSTEPPLGVFGGTLKVIFHAICVDTAVLKNLELAVAAAHLDAIMMIPASYASGLSVLVDDERRLGAAVVDIGSSCVDISLYARGVPVFAAVLPGGGACITEDIARRLLTAFEAAERIKTVHGHAMTGASDHTHMIDVPCLGDASATIERPRAHVNDAIGARLKSQLEAVRTVLEGEGFYDQKGATIVLTGGVAETSGILPLASAILGPGLRIGGPKRLPDLPLTAQSTMYASAVGLVLFIAGWSETKQIREKRNKRLPSISRLFKWLLSRY